MGFSPIELELGLSEILFVVLRAISWIESLPKADDPLNHTNPHEKNN
jgi:hypothetical protein